MPVATTQTEVVKDSMGSTLNIGDYVLANIRDYHAAPSAGNSGSYRKMVRGTVMGFLSGGKVRVRADGDESDNYLRSWVTSRHVTLIAPEAMAEGYKEAFKFHVREGE